MREDDAFRFGNVLHAWAEFDGNRVAASGDGWVRFTQTTGGRTALPAAAAAPSWQWPRSNTKAAPLTGRE
jgi:hypothetical protein